MPIYLYINDNSNEIKEIFQSMSEPHVYSEGGVEWRRIFTIPHAATDCIGHIDPFSKKDFVEKTRSKKGSVGDLWSASKEAGEKRKDKLGVSIDPQRQKWYDKWSKDRGGKRTMPKRYLYE